MRHLGTFIVFSVLVLCSCRGDLPHSDDQSSAVSTEAEREAARVNDALLSGDIEVDPGVNVSQTELCIEKWKVALQGIGKNWQANFGHAAAFCNNALHNATYKGWNGRYYLKVSKFNRIVDDEIQRVIREHHAKIGAIGPPGPVPGGYARWEDQWANRADCCQRFHCVKKEPKCILFGAPHPADPYLEDCYKCIQACLNPGNRVNSCSGVRVAP